MRSESKSAPPPQKKRRKKKQHFMFEEDKGIMKLNELEKQKSERQNFYQKAKHAKLYFFDLLQA